MDTDVFSAVDQFPCRQAWPGPFLRPGRPKNRYLVVEGDGLPQEGAWVPLAIRAGEHLLKVTNVDDQSMNLDYIALVTARHVRDK